jgi:transcriptional regulator of acetoin/glycerol metabolism
MLTFAATLFDQFRRKMKYENEGWVQFVRKVEAATVSNLPRPYIAESWRRCRKRGVSQALDNYILLRRVDAAELERRLQVGSVLHAAATPLLRDFSEKMGAVEHVVYATDRDGIVLCSAGNDYNMLLYGLLPGFDWSENTMGTNGAGTALATGRPVAVIGPDHYQLPFREATCLGAPIRSPQGDIIGAVDFSTHVKDAHISHLALVVELARAIESYTLRDVAGAKAGD